MSNRRIDFPGTLIGMRRYHRQRTMNSWNGTLHTDASRDNPDDQASQRRVTMKPTETVSTADPCSAPTAAVALFRSLGDPARLAILRRLAEGEARVTDLVVCIGLAQSTVSAHLSCLRDCGLITSRPQGRASLYSLARPELLDLLASAEHLLAATGEAVDLCPAYGTVSAAEESVR